MNIINNGINLKLLKVGEKKKNSFICSGCLDKILKIWSIINKNLEDPILYICNYNDIENDLREQINTYDNIICKDNISTEDLYELMSVVDYWLYLNIEPDTSFMIALEMMACGVVCLYYPIGELINIMNDNGIKLEVGKEIDKIKELDEQNKIKIKNNALEYVQQFSWENIAKEWDIMFNIN